MKRVLSGPVAFLFAAALLGAQAGPCAADVPAAAQPIRKLSRGLANGLGGLLAIPVTIRQVGDQEGPLAGMTWGLFVGVGVAVTRTLVGVAEILTFPFPLPEIGYGPLLRPEFLLQPDGA